MLRSWRHEFRTSSWSKPAIIVVVLHEGETEDTRWKRLHEYEETSDANTVQRRVMKSSLRGLAQLFSIKCRCSTQL
ncbi:hypothetical protein DL98DRAFT_210718 [Cadophora sp. DSE1049]|nr:hypothetical protein DL98DRAFT_210718 [Cadophora sp. DSE1049]